MLVGGENSFLHVGGDVESNPLVTCIRQPTEGSAARLRMSNVCLSEVTMGVHMEGWIVKFVIKFVKVDLPLSVALLSSYLQQPVQGNTLFVGELDLTTRVRPLANLAAVLLGPEAGSIRKVFMAKEAAARMKRLQAEKDGPRVGDIVDVRAVHHRSNPRH